MRVSLWSWVCVVSMAGTGVGCTPTAGTQPDEMDGGSEDGGSKGDGGASCALGDITADRTLSPEDCATYRPEGDVMVREGATLILAPGTQIHFASGSWLLVEDGRLDARGTADAPVVLRGTDDDAAAGYWLGVHIRAGGNASLASTSIRDGGDVDRGCFTADSDAGNVTLTDSRFANCEGAGVRSSRVFTSFRGNTIEESTVGLWLDADVIGSIEDAVVYSGVAHNRIENGYVTSSARWVAQDIPWHVSTDMYVGGTSTPILTLDPGTVLRFARDTWLGVGYGEPGGLVAGGDAGPEVVLGAIDVGAAAGAWLGLRFDDSTLSGSSLTQVRIEQAGDVGHNHGCLSVYNTLADVLSVTDSTFARCERAAVVVRGDASHFAAFSGNRVLESETGLAMDANTIGSLDDAVLYDTSVQRNEITSEYVRRSATWPSQSVDWHVLGNLYVEQQGGVAVLTLANDTFRFTSDSWLAVGYQSDSGGALNATSVVFDAINEGTSSRAWTGLHFNLSTSPSMLTDITVSQAGDSGNGYGGISLFETGNHVTINNPSFDHNEPSDIYYDCYSSPVLQNLPVDAVVVQDNNC